MLFCGKTSHTVDTCFKKHGFPSNYKKGYTTVNNISSTVNDEEEEDDEEEDSTSEEVQLTSSFGLTKE